MWSSLCSPNYHKAGHAIVIVVQLMGHFTIEFSDIFFHFNTQTGLFWGQINFLGHPDPASQGAVKMLYRLVVVIIIFRAFLHVKWWI